MSDFIVTIDDRKFTVNTNHSEKVLLNGKVFDLEVLQLSEHTYNIKLNNNIFHITSSKLNDGRYFFLIDGYYFESDVRTKLEEEAANLLSELSGGSGPKQIKSPMPGLILRINKKIGDEVKAGESLILLEAMKMENEIRATSDGIVKEINISEGNSVEKNQVLLTIS